MILGMGSQYRLLHKGITELCRSLRRVELLRIEAVNAHVHLTRIFVLKILTTSELGCCSSLLHIAKPAAFLKCGLLHANNVAGMLRSSYIAIASFGSRITNNTGAAAKRDTHD